jgi:hypothetical protein
MQTIIIHLRHNHFQLENAENAVENSQSFAVMFALATVKLETHISNGFFSPFVFLPFLLKLIPH